MEDGMSTEFEGFIAERKLIRTRIGRGMIEKEIEAAESDLKDARDSLERGSSNGRRYRDTISCFTAPGRCSTAEVSGRRATLPC